MHEKCQEAHKITLRSRNSRMFLLILFHQYVNYFCCMNVFNFAAIKFVKEQFKTLVNVIIPVVSAIIS